MGVEGEKTVEEFMHIFELFLLGAVFVELDSRVQFKKL